MTVCQASRGYGLVSAPDLPAQQRGGVRHPELLGFVRENRPRIVSAGLTLCRAWFVAGCPDGTGGRQPFGKFEAWERVISGVLANAGVSGFLANLDQF